jgi:hypothetical protein
MVLYAVVRATGAVMAPLVMLTIALWIVRVPLVGSKDRRLSAKKRSALRALQIYSEAARWSEGDVASPP